MPHAHNLGPLHSPFQEPPHQADFQWSLNQYLLLSRLVFWSRSPILRRQINAAGLRPQTHQDEGHLTAKVGRGFQAGAALWGDTYRPGTQCSSSEAANTLPCHRPLESSPIRMGLMGFQVPLALSPSTALTAPKQPPSPGGEWEEVTANGILSSLHIWVHVVRLSSRKLYQVTLLNS